MAQRTGRKEPHKAMTWHAATLHGKKAHSAKKSADAALRNPAKKMADGTTGQTSAIGMRQPVSPAILIVALFCALYALQMGMFEPNLYFQQASGQAILSDNCTFESQPAQAYAIKNRLAMPVMRSQGYSVASTFEGAGNADTVLVKFDDPFMSITKLAVNGKELCSPCNDTRPIKLDGGSAKKLSLMLEAKARQPNSTDWGQSGGLVFFEKRLTSRLVSPATIEVRGGWSAKADSWMPSSFYGVDAPFHISRIPVLARYLSRFSWPDASYSFVSMLPPALLYMATGVSQQYAYKVYEIALFFVPVALFYFFSRKLSHGRDAVFLFSSLIYLFLPAVGYPAGGGPDLFFYGMTPHTLATYLSLGFLYFGYGYSVEGRRIRLAFAALLFLLAFISNPRIALALGGMLALLCANMLWKRQARRSAILALACAASVAWVAIPFVQSFSFETYSALGGVRIEGETASLLLIVQTGYVVLPVLFIIGAYAAWKRKENFALVFCASGLTIFAVATSGMVNSAFPFIDGLRLLPSFLLPMFFISGLGAKETYFLLVRTVKEYGKRAGMDEVTLAGAFALALLAPAAVVFLMVAFSTVQQYSAESSSANLVMSYVALERAYGTVGNEPVIFISSSGTSQYPEYEKNPAATSVAGFENASSLVGDMMSEKIRYAIVGNTKRVNGMAEKTRWQEYDEITSDGRLERLPSFDAAPLFALKGGKPGAEAAPVPGQKHYDYEFALTALCAAALAGCFWLSGKRSA